MLPSVSCFSSSLPPFLSFFFLLSLCKGSFLIRTVVHFSSSKCSLAYDQLLLSWLVSGPLPTAVLSVWCHLISLFIHITGLGLPAQKSWLRGSLATAQVAERLALPPFGSLLCWLCTEQTVSRQSVGVGHPGLLCPHCINLTSSRQRANGIWNVNFSWCGAWHSVSVSQDRQKHPTTKNLPKCSRLLELSYKWFLKCLFW